MKNYNKIQPEVIVGLGSETIFREKEPPFKTIEKLHIDLEDWLGDDLMECFPAYTITENLKISLENKNFTGFKFSKMKVLKAEYFENNYQLEKNLPNFYWLQIIGEELIDDVFLNTEKELYVKPRFLNYLKNNFNLRYLEVDPERNEFDDLLDKMLADE